MSHHGIDRLILEMAQTTSDSPFDTGYRSACDDILELLAACTRACIQCGLEAHQGDEDHPYVVTDTLGD